MRGHFSDKSNLRETYLFGMRLKLQSPLENSLLNWFRVPLWLHERVWTDLWKWCKKGGKSAGSFPSSHLNRPALLKLMFVFTVIPSPLTVRNKHEPERFKGAVQMQNMSDLNTRRDQMCTVTLKKHRVYDEKLSCWSTRENALETELNAVEGNKFSFKIYPWKGNNQQTITTWSTG